MTESSPEKFQFVLRLGELNKPLEAGRNYTIGRETACDLRLGHGTVSSFHCRLQVTEDQVTVHDLNSLSGTRITGEPITDRAWKPGEVLEVGDIRIELLRRPMPAPAARAVGASAGAPNILAHQRHEPEFGELVWGELKRAPWFALSVLIHGLILLVVWFFCENEVPKGPDARVISMESTEEEDVYEDEVEVIEEETMTEEMDDSTFEDVEVSELEEEFVEDVDVAVFDAGMMDTSHLLTKIATGTGLDDILRAGKHGVSDRFRKGVEERRKNGLEIVFVFDSTGSMGSVLQAAKDRISKMVGVLLELVPYAKIGVITYRDHGNSEAYLMRKVALSRDFYRAMNFMQVIYAGGGADEPEAVYAALRMAVAEKWSPTSRRLVILIGDAPPHKKTEGKISSMVRNFARNGRSFVHAIVTRPSAASDITKVTERTFKRIARDGKGQTLAFEKEAKILKAVMSLAFGRADSRSLDEVYRLAELRRTKSSTTARRMAEGKDMPRLRKEFQRRVVAHDLVKAILANPQPVVLNRLVDFISQSSLNKAGKHAAAYILQQALQTAEPPVDPETGKAISRNRAKLFHRTINRKFR